MFAAPTPFLDVLKRRYTTKAFDPQQRLTTQQVADIHNLLQWAPSSTNAQPWHFVLAGSPEGKARVAKATSGPYAFNQQKILDASHVLVMAGREHVDAAYLERLLAQEQADGRFATAAAREGQHQGRGMFVDMHQQQLQDGPHWHAKQVYLALGFLLLGVAAMGIDACPMEGFDADALDAELNFNSQGLSSVVVVALGMHRSDDFNARLPKSRWPQEQLFTHI